MSLTNTIPELFNTLAQNGTERFKKSAIVISGTGSELSNKKDLKGRAKRKLITQKMDNDGDPICIVTTEIVNNEIGLQFT
ncbi:MAG: hypothetical protein ACXWC7_08500 [Chitinophagaceae bacterium]